MRWWLLTIAPSSDIAALLRSVGFPWGKLAAAQPQVTDEGMVIAHNLLGKVTCFPPHPSVLPLVELPPSPHCGFAAGEGFWSDASHKSNAPRKRSFPY